MSRLVALLAPQVCAAALRQPWPDDPTERVRCIEAGTRAVGLDIACAPWSPEAEDAALADELGAPPPAAAGFDEADDITRWLAATPAAPPVVAIVSGPGGWSRRGPAHPDSLDIASDLSADRVRAVAAAGVERLVVIETVGSEIDGEALAEAHQPILRTAAHLRLDVTLVATGETAAAGSLGYERWVSPSAGADHLAYLEPDAFESLEALTRRLGSLGGPREVITGHLGPETSPEVVRHGASLVASAGTRR